MHDKNVIENQIWILKNIVKILIFNFSYLLKNVTTIIVLIIFLISGSLFSVIFVPLRFCISIPLFISTIIPSMCLFVIVNTVWKNSTIYKNYKINNENTLHFHIASFIQFFLVTFTFAILLICLLEIYDEMHILKYYWEAGGSNEKYDIFNVLSFPFFYSLFELVLVSYSIMLVLSYMVKTQKLFFIIIFSFLILEILFGGFLNTYFWSQSITTDDHLNYGDYRVYTEDRSMYPSSWFWPTEILFPFFGPSQHLQSIKIFCEKEYSFFKEDIDWFHWNSSSDWIIYIKNDVEYCHPLTTNSIYWWNSLWFISYIHITIFASIAVVLSKYTKR